MSLDIITVMLVSLFAGFLGALTGLGGGTIVIPVLTFLDVPLKYAIANSMITIISTSSGSASAYVREKLANIKVAMYLEIFTVIGAIVGATITLLISSKYLYFFFAAFLLTSFYGIRKKIQVNTHENIPQDKFSKWLELEGSYYDESLKKKVDYKIIRAHLGGPAMMIAGLAAGMLGIGAGAFKVAIHELILKMPSKVSSSTSNFIIGMTALAGSSVFIASGLITVTLAAPIAIGTTIGSLIGSRILPKMRDKTIRTLFLIILVYLIIQMLYKGVISL
ncbi:MAG: sulfite exporter TauE/SafE family protein [Thermoprotei archaeon]|jgi:uncharacterized membrane protein YfcA